MSHRWYYLDGAAAPTEPPTTNEVRFTLWALSLLDRFFDVDGALFRAEVFALNRVRRRRAQARTMLVCARVMHAQLLAEHQRTNAVPASLLVPPTLHQVMAEMSDTSDEDDDYTFGIF